MTAAVLVATTLSSLPVLAQNELAPGEGARLLAHRGGRNEIDENTLEAFQHAFDSGCWAFETDVRFTKDKELMILHDNDFKRMCGIEKAPEEMTAAEIREIRTKEGHRIPFLKDVLNLLKNYDGAYVEFELKTTREDLYPEPVLTRFADEIYAAISAARPANSTYVFSSFDARILKYLNARHPGEPIMYITSQGCTGETRAILKEIGIKRMACYRTRTTREEMDKAHEEGILINLWPTKDAVEVNLAYALGADYICTDRPRLICSLIDEGVIPVKK